MGSHHYRLSSIESIVFKLHNTSYCLNPPPHPPSPYRSGYGTGNGPRHITRLNCTGAENSVLDCSKENSTISPCESADQMAVICCECVYSVCMYLQYSRETKIDTYYQRYLLCTVLSMVLREVGTEQ